MSGAINLTPHQRAEKLRSLGLAIQAARIKRGPEMTVAKLSSLTGIHRNTLAAVEQGRHNLSYTHLAAIASALGFDEWVIVRETKRASALSSEAA